MKKLAVIIAFLFLVPFSIQAQRGDRMEKIKALKTAYITSELDLTSKEAQKFWPIYNSYAEKIEKLRFQDSRQLFLKIKEAGGVENLSEKEATAMISSLSTIDLEIAKEKDKLYKDLKGVISSKKILKLIKAESSFGKELLKKFRDNRPRESFEEN